MTLRESPNVLVISDLHLGEELLPGSSDDRRGAVAMAEAAFIEFMRHHQRFRADGRPWRLVINGDLFDFMSVRAGTGDGVAVDAVERHHPLGAGRREDASIARMRIMGVRYQTVFAQMMRFAGAGHRIDIIAGNHDQELMWPSVWAELQRALIAACPTGIDADAALGRIVLARWFIYEPGVAWIEHGHQYDDACSWEFGLAPTNPRTGELATNVDYAALRHISSAAPDVDTHGTEEWTFGGFMKFALSRGPAAALHYITGYSRFVGSLLVARRLHQSVRIRRQRAAIHEQVLTQLATETGVDRAKLAQVDRLARAPMTKSSRRLARMLRLDRLRVRLGVLVVALIALIALPVWAALITAGVAAAVGHKATEWLGPAPMVQAAMTLVPDKIQKILDVPAVVFGHTHEPLRLDLRGGGHYLNSGTWLPAIRPGLLRSFTHVAILRGADGGARTELRQWKDGASRLWVERGERTERAEPVAPVRVAPAAAPAVARVTTKAA